MNNQNLYDDFLSEPMKGAVTNMHKNSFDVWFGNDLRVTIQKAQRYSHQDLKLGDLKEFVVTKKETDSNGTVYVMEIIGMNNHIIPFKNRPKEKQVNQHAGVTRIKALTPGIYDAMIVARKDKKIRLDFNNMLRWVYIPRNLHWEDKENNVPFKMKVEHEEKEGTLRGLLKNIDIE